MARVCKSLKAPEQGYRHRDHRATKCRAPLSRTDRLKRKLRRERLEELYLKE